MRGIGVAILSFVATATLPAQDNQAKRLSSIVGVAVEEYAKAVDERGKLVSKDEFDETYGFLTDARPVAARLSGYDAAKTRAILDSMIAAVSARKPPTAVRVLHANFMASLGTAGAMDLPKAPLDTADGHAVYATSCASCHGATGAGDGPLARTLNPPPPAIGVRSQTPDLTPTLAYNVISVGVRGTRDAGVRGIAHSAATLERHQLHLRAPRREADSAVRRAMPQRSPATPRHQSFSRCSTARSTSRVRVRPPKRATARSMRTSRSSRWKRRRAQRSRD